MTPGAFQTTFTPKICGIDIFPPIQCSTAFVIKLGPSGTIVYATYLDGSEGSEANGIAVDSAGNAYVAGTTSSSDFPVTAGAVFTTGSGFIVKLNPAGSGLVYGTLIPYMTPLALAIDNAGNAYATGPALPSFPTTAGVFQTAPKSSSSAYSGAMVKLNASGSALVYATFLCGSGLTDNLDAIAVDAAGDAVIAGWTYSSDFPVTPGAFQTTAPSQRSMVASELNPTGSGLMFSTYLSSTNTTAPSVRFDSQGGVYVLGETADTFPVTAGAYDSTASFVFLADLSGVGSLRYATYLPLVLGDGIGQGMDLDSAGNLLIAGTASGPSLPTGPGAFQSASEGYFNSYIMKFSPAMQLLGATYLGGPGDVEVYSITAAPNGSVAVGGDGFVISLFPAVTVQNAAGFTANTIAPGEIVAIRGYGIGPAAGATAQAAPDGSLPTELAGVSVEFGGFNAPLFYSQNQQVNAQVPWEIAGSSSVPLQIQFQAGASSLTAGPLPIPVSPDVPGIFCVTNSDGTLNSPSNPAHAGDYIAMYGTGGGALSTPGVTGSPWPLAPLSDLTQKVAVTVGGQAATSLYAGSAPTLNSGVFQINVQLPADLTAGVQSLTVMIGGLAGPPVAISIH